MSTLRYWSFGARATPVVALVFLGATGCRMGIRNEQHAGATLFDAAGRQVGVLQLSASGGSVVTVAGQFHGLATGPHGIHFHAVGRCDPAGAFGTAGGHFNPTSRRHGLESTAGPHAGDLPNLTIDSRGAGSYRATTSRVSLAHDAGSLLDADGSAVIVHAAADDQRTDPSGNSGARVACGVVKAT